MKFIQFCLENLLHTGPILAAGLLGILIAVERGYALMGRFSFSASDSFLERVKFLVLADRLEEALGLCRSYEGKPLVRVVSEALLRAHQPIEVVQNGLRVVVDEEGERIQARTGFLSTIANVATLLGLFGTILGLVHSFEAVGAASAQERSAMLAAGISTAMNATMLGLGVAIPCMVAFSFLTYRTTRLVAELERAAVRVVDLLEQRFLAGDESTAAAPASAVAPVYDMSARRR